MSEEQLDRAQVARAVPLFATRSVCRTRLASSLPSKSSKRRLLTMMAPSSAISELMLCGGMPEEPAAWLRHLRADPRGNRGILRKLLAKQRCIQGAYCFVTSLYLTGVQHRWASTRRPYLPYQ